MFSRCRAEHIVRKPYLAALSDYIRLQRNIRFDGAANGLSAPSPANNPRLDDRVTYRHYGRCSGYWLRILHQMLPRSQNVELNHDEVDERQPNEQE